MEKSYSHTCIRCGIEKQYLGFRHWKTVVKRPDCTFCKGIPDDSVASLKNGVYSLRCKRCNLVSTYTRKNSLVAVLKKQTVKCVQCQSIPNETLHLFVTKGIFARICPKCKGIVEHSTKAVLRAARRLNCQCHSCSAKETAITTRTNLRAQWTPIIGYDNYTYRTLVAVRHHWEQLTETERQEILNKTPRQKYYYWGHLRRKNRGAGHRLCREVMAQKYSGDNHWVRRPEVYLKILKSCEKYKGDGHWFRNKKKELTTSTPVI